MPEQLSVAVLGFWHVHAADHARSVRHHPQTRLTAAWDPDPDRGRAGAADLGVEFVPDLATLLARPDIDAVTVTTATAEHPEVLGAAVRAGKHVFTEKLLAGSVAEAEEILAAARERGVRIAVALPRLTEAVPLAVCRLRDEGRLGRISYARVRLAHDGWVDDWLPEQFADRAAALGGALTDLGCHAVYLTQLFLGSAPRTVSAGFTRLSGRAVEDNAVVTTTYPGGAIGVAEASFVTTPGAFTVEVRGTKGSLLHGFNDNRLLAKGDAFDPGTWTEVPLPEPGPDPFSQWVDHIGAGTDVDGNLRAAVELTRLVAAANTAAATGRTVDYRRSSAAGPGGPVDAA